MPALPNPPRRPPPAGPILLALVAFVLVGGGIYALRSRHSQPGLPAPHATADASPAPTAAVDDAPEATPDPGKFQGLRVLTTRPVAYPEQAFLNRVEGTVRVKFQVDDTGHVTNVSVPKSSGSVLLDAVALSHDLKQWTFQPATLDGKPVPGTVEKDFEFHLDPAQQRTMAAKRLAAKVGTPDAPYPKEALASRPQGACTINVSWTPVRVVDRIYLSQSSGSNLLDRVALRFAYENWRVDSKNLKLEEEFSKTMTFTPPAGANDTPPPLNDAGAAPTVAP